MTGSLGVLGGIFDPVHNGHLAVASLAREALGLKKIIFFPQQSSYKVQQSVLASDRLNMLRCALKRRDDIIWESELKRPLSLILSILCFWSENSIVLYISLLIR